LSSDIEIIKRMGNINNNEIPAFEIKAGISSSII